MNNEPTLAHRPTDHHFLELNSAVNDELLKIMEWLNINKLSLKTINMTFQKSNKVKYTFMLNINNINIERVEEQHFALSNLLQKRECHDVFFE